MITWIVRIILVLAGFITSLFVSRNALNFSVIQMTVAVLLFTSLVIVIAFWPAIKKLVERKNKQKEDE